MLLRRFYDPKLAQASYLIGCPASGEALVVDPNRDIDPYLQAADEEGLRIAHVTETHIHADFVSGARELAHRAGARLYLSDAGGNDWSYQYAAEADAIPLSDGIPLQSRRGRDPGAACAGTHAGASGLPRHRYRDRIGADGCFHRRLHLRRRRRASRPAGAGRASQGHDGSGGPAALPVAAAIPRAARLPPDLARPWRRLRLRQGARRGAAVHSGLREAVQLGLRHRRRSGVRAGGARGAARSAAVLRRDEADQPRGASAAGRHPAARTARGGQPGGGPGAGGSSGRYQAGGRLCPWRGAGDDQHRRQPELHHLGRMAAAVRSGLLSDRGRSQGADDRRSGARPGRDRARPNRGLLRRRGGGGLARLQGATADDAIAHRHRGGRADPHQRQGGARCAGGRGVEGGSPARIAPPAARRAGASG